MRKGWLFILLIAVLPLGCKSEEGPPGPVVVGSKNFTESVILGEMLAQTTERAGCEVDRKLNMGGTFVVDRGLRTGSVDTYVEYSGTALTAILDHEPRERREAIRRLIRNEYDDASLVWGPPLGFENTFAIIVRKRSAEEYDLSTITDLQRVDEFFQPGFGYEFGDRQDGWDGLLDTYRLSFEKPAKTMDLGLTYRALAEGELDVIAGNSTDGLIEHLDLVVLEDDRDYFPPYDAVIVYRKDLSAKCPSAISAYEALRKSLDERTMRRLNYEVDGEHRDVSEVVSEFLAGTRTAER
ncbi:MAG: glycine betaine ABC transporter substrate-binding protein [Thermoanaerobaculia bacterium]|nr:glycine betaine ABC transporter substrate-binding protein [Thermoanaerobaculia bacterium]